MKASEDAVVKEGAEDARGSIVLQLFSEQLEIHLLIFEYISTRIAVGNVKDED